MERRTKQKKGASGWVEGTGGGSGEDREISGGVKEERWSR